MSHGQNGGPPWHPNAPPVGAPTPGGFPAGNAWGPPISGVPPTGQQFVQPPPWGAAPAPPSWNTNDGSEAVHELQIPWPLRGIPGVCACCGGPAETTRTALKTSWLGLAKKIPTVKIPYCFRCNGHIAAGSARRWISGALAMLAGFVGCWILQAVWRYVPTPVVIVLGVLVSLVTLAGVNRQWRAVPVARERGCTAGERDALWIENLAASVRFRGVNLSWLYAFGQMHGAAPQPAGTRGPAPARWVAATSCALVVATLAWFAMHGEVYFDNPSSAPLTFDVDDGAERLTVNPGAYRSVWLPLGGARVAVKSGDGRTLEMIPGEVESLGNHAVTPLGLGCYATVTLAYGTARVVGPGYVPADRSRRWHTLPGQIVLEPFPETVSVSGGQTGDTRQRFGRVTCPPAEPSR